MQSVANKIIRETAFELKDVAQKPIFSFKTNDLRVTNRKNRFKVIDQ